MVVMAPPPKLKQSSIASFLKQTEPVLPESEPETKSKPSSSDYENLRQQTIRRNQSFLQTLGIHPLPFKPESKPKSRPKPKPTATPPPSAPLLRSSRHRAPPPSPPPPQDVVIAEAPVLDFADSPVFRYACDPSITLPPTPTLPPPPSLPLLGFEITGMPLRDPSLTKIYTLDVSLLHKDRFLVAAGGHGGFISLFGVGGEEMRMPLMSWKGSRGWISGVGFLEKNPMVLVSSSNDGKVVLWDIKKQSSSVAASASASPAVVAEVGDLHSGGVFSMSLRDEMIATASKDSSVGVSRIRDEGEVVNERNVSGHHEGAVRGICFG